MMLLPIVVRELQVASRRRATYRMRFYLVLALLGVGLWMLLFGQASVLARQQGQILFRAMGVLAFVFCLVAGAFFTADCLSEEKREGTLGLLFLTDLRGYDVVLGKLIATSLHAFYGLLAVLPVLSLPLLMGSVGFWEFARMSLALMTTLFASLSIGLLVSAVWLRSRQTMTITLVLLLLLAGLPLAPLALPRSGPPNRGLELTLLCLAAPSPVALFLAGLQSNYGLLAFCIPLGALLCLGCAALVSPCFYAPRAWRETGEQEPAPTPAVAPRRMRLRRLRPARRRAWLERNPFSWLASRERTPQWMALFLLAPLFTLWCALLVGAWLELGGPGNWEMFELAALVAYGMHQLLKYLIAVEAARRLSEDKRSGTLELLLVTPLSVKDILAGQGRALRSLFLWPSLLALATNAGLCAFFLAEALAGRWSPMPWMVVYLSLASLGGAAIFFFDAQALSLAAMWLSVKTGRQRRAVLGALGRVMLGPWLSLVALVLIRGHPNVALDTMVLWLGVAALIDASAVNWARSGLLGGLRDPPPAAPEDQAPPPSEPSPLEARAASPAEAGP